MNENELRRRLRKSIESMRGGDPPEFHAVWASAEARHRASRSRYQKIAGLAAAAAVTAMAFTLWPTNGNNVTAMYLTEEDLMSSTQWLAPSDVLLPVHQFDIYGDLPVLIETNDLDEGSTL